MRTAPLQAWRSRLGSAGFLAGLVFVGMAAKGEGCVPEPDPGGSEECTQPADCDGLAHIACVGAWTCEANQCAWDCHTEPPTGCYSDAECPSGYECNSDTVCLPPPGCEPGHVCPAVCYGECVKKAEPPATCTSSAQCPSGTHCSTDDGVCNSACGGFAPHSDADGAPQRDMECPAVCTGECVDNGTWCFSDTECSAGQWCDRSECGGTAPSADAAGARIACGGVCRDRDACNSNQDCSAGETCSCVVPTTNAAGAIMACDLRCVPTAPIECYSNAECPANTHCMPDCHWLPSDSSGGGDSDRAAEYCPSHCVPDRTCGDQGLVCGPNEICSSECWADPVDCNCTGDQPCDCPAVATCEAKCVPQDGSCHSNLDCKPGYYCGCGPFDASSPSGLMACNLTCLPEATECRSDADCGGDSFCNLSQCGTATDAKRPCAPDDANCGMPAPPPCTGTCEPRPTMCSTNADCGSGYECVIDVCAGSSDPNGGASEFMCWGHCQVVDPKPYECWADADCGGGGWCEYDYQNCASSFAPPPDGDMPMPMPVCGGWCHYPDPIPCDPWGDMTCPEGTECQMVSGCGGMTPVPASGVPCMMNYQCVPVVKPECSADCDCAFGFGCVAGTCQLQEPVGPCDDAWSCKEGYTCGCPTRFGGPASGIACFPQCYPERPECCDDSQCGGGEMCVNGACEPMYCYDQKCPEGYHCESQCGGPVPAGGLMACPMVCVKDAPTCASDCDCDIWTACINGECQVADRLNECHGGQCMSDADCGDGGVCRFEPYACPCSIDENGKVICPDCGPPPDARGWCEYPPKETLCGPNGECPSGFACNECAHGSCPMCDDCVAVCEPEVDLGCRADADCATGERCDFKACTATGACAPGMDCAICVGQCVPKEDTNPCFATGCSGQICSDRDVMSTCEFLPWYACYKLASCGQDAAGTCGWSETPEFLKCMQELGGFSSAGGAPQ